VVPVGERDVLLHVDVPGKSWCLECLALAQAAE
jgi:hypothetical protein